MLKNEDIICISSIDWDFIWQGHQEIMTRFARSGNRVLFIENTGVRTPTIKDVGRIKDRFVNWLKGIHGIRKIEDGLYIYSPLVLPFPYLKAARYINKKFMLSVLIKWLRAVGFSEPIVWTFLPTGLTIDLIREIEPKVMIYYCIDSFRSSSKDARKIRKTERAIISMADLVFVTSQELYKHCARFNTKVHSFPFGVNIENFRRALGGTSALPEDLQHVKHPIAGYIGGIHKWIDFDLIYHAASNNTGVSFVFCGPIQTNIERVKSLPNVIFLGQKDTKDLPRYVNEFDVAMIPYRVTEYTRNVYPTKLNEYLSMGKRVISTELPEVVMFNERHDNIVRVARTKEMFSDIVRQTIERPFDAHEADVAMKVAEQNSWVHRIEQMSELIERTGSDKSEEREKMWKSNLTRFYRTTKRGIIRAAVVAGVAYAVVFYTPLVWFLAEPLKVADPAQKADVIVALGAGVGESGKVGQGYEERVSTAVNLYKRHFADTIVYASGYRYIMKEAEVMKALSVAMGVDEHDVLVDNTPVSTYEMVRNIAALAHEHGWKRILLVSSPYHMLRLRLLCKKYLPAVQASFIPTEKNVFYSHGRRLYAWQLRGFLHEYAAIVYYRLKGYM